MLHQPGRYVSTSDRMKQQNLAVEMNKAVYTIHGKKRCKILSFNSKERVPKKGIYPDCYGIFRAKESTTPCWSYAFLSVWDVGDGDLVSNPQVFQCTDVEFHPGTIRLDVFEGIRPDGKTRGVEVQKPTHRGRQASQVCNTKFRTCNAKFSSLWYCDNWSIVVSCIRIWYILIHI